MPVSDCPDVDEGHVDWYSRVSSRPLDTTDGDDVLARRDEFFGDKANVESSIERGEKAFGDVLEALEMPGADGHPFR